MSIRWSGRAVGAAALVLAVGGCGGRDASGEEKDGAAAAASRERVEMCELVPKAEIEGIVGAPVANTSGNFSEHTYSKPVSYTSSCIYMGERTVCWASPIPRARATPPRRSSRTA